MFNSKNSAFDHGVTIPWFEKQGRVKSGRSARIHGADGRIGHHTYAQSNNRKFSSFGPPAPEKHLKSKPLTFALVYEAKISIKRW